MNIKALFHVVLVTKNGEITAAEGVRDHFLDSQLKIQKNGDKEEWSEVNMANSNHIFPWRTEDNECNVWNRQLELGLRCRTVSFKGLRSSSRVVEARPLQLGKRGFFLVVFKLIEFLTSFLPRSVHLCRHFFSYLQLGKPWPFLFTPSESTAVISPLLVAKKYEKKRFYIRWSSTEFRGLFLFQKNITYPFSCGNFAIFVFNHSSLLAFFFLYLQLGKRGLFLFQKMNMYPFSCGNFTTFGR